MTGRFAEAERVFWDDLRINPQNPRSLFGRWQCLVAQKDTTEAARVKAQFEGAWRDADAPLSMESL
jgi:hypothetical protein